MILKLNSGIAVILLCLYALGFLVAAPVIYVVQVHTTGLPTIIPEGQWIYSIFFLYEYLDHIIIAIWLLLNVPELKEDAATWILCGLAFGILAIPLFVTVMIYQRNYGNRFRTSFSSLMLILLPYYALRFFQQYFWNMFNLVKLPEEWQIDAMAYSIITIYFGALMFIMNILLTVFILQVLKSKERAWVWGLSTLILGAGPVIIKLLFLSYSRKRVVAKDMA